MKDAYSFHADQTSLQQAYDRMYEAYSTIFARLGLNFRAVLADTGSIGGSASHEFHVLAGSGEDDIAFSDSSNFAANVELAEALPVGADRQARSGSIEKIATPNARSVEEVAELLNCESSHIAKTLIVQGSHDEEGHYGFVALILRGDHTLNELKAEKHPAVHSPLTFATEEEVVEVTGALPGSVGPVGLSIPVLVDRSADRMSNFYCGANESDHHFAQVNWDVDVTASEIVDLRNVETGDPSPCGNGNIEIKRGIEVGHIFQLGEKYSKALNCSVLNENGKDQVVTMGCYGIGITRVVAAAIEQNYDDNGIKWPAALAPFQVAIAPINYHKSSAVAAACDRIYDELTQAGIEVILMDAEKARLGGILADIELVGITHRIVVGDRGLEAGEIEYRHRHASDNEALAADNVVAELLARING